MKIDNNISVQTFPSFLIVEPNCKLENPYNNLSTSAKIYREKSIELALSVLRKEKPSVVFLSASFSPSKSLKFLEALKNICSFELIPLIIVVDFSNRLNFVPGISWGRKISIIDSFTPKKEFISTFNRILQSKVAQ